MTLHADEEMFNGGLTIFDIEHAVLTGRIQERQRAGMAGQWKYRVQGFDRSGDTIEAIVKMSSAGSVIITVFRR